MNFLGLSKSQLSRDEMRSVTGGTKFLKDDDGGQEESCFSYCPCSYPCKCIHIHGHDRCYT
jgi:hypothetical protein